MLLWDMYYLGDNLRLDLRQFKKLSAVVLALPVRNDHFRDVLHLQRSFGLSLYRAEHMRGSYFKLCAVGRPWAKVLPIDAAYYYLISNARRRPPGLFVGWSGAVVMDVQR